MAAAQQPSRRLYPWETPDEVVKVETPEQIVVEYRIAPFGSRIMAALVDYLVIYVTLIVAFLLLVWAFGFAITTGEEGVSFLFAGYLLFVFAIQLFYFAWYEIRREGQTPGKRMIGVRAVMADGRGMTVGAALIRNFARIFDNSIVLWLVPALDRRRRRIGDFLAGTLVVRAGKEKADEFRYNPSRYETDPTRRDFYFSAEVLEQLYVDDLNLLEHFFTRLKQVRGRRRSELLLGFALKYRDRLGLEEQSERIESDPHRFVFELYVLLKERFEKEVY